MTPVLFRPAAAADVEAAYEWYQVQQKGLGDEFLDELTAILESISSNPNVSQLVHRGTRRALVRRFPYAVFYRVFEAHIVVLACMHGSREPRRWQERD